MSLTYQRVAPSEAKTVGSCKTEADVLSDVKKKLRQGLAKFKAGETIGRLIVKRDIGSDRRVECLRVGIASQTTSFVPLPDLEEDKIKVIQEVINDLDSWSADLYATWKLVQQKMIDARAKTLAEANKKAVA
jgi:hypothetical protein